ncbi:carbohydrate ABC transporter permease [Glycomyces algeriensis]|uniref:Sugar ABC transporter permease n=1 Tax=Glycomyces algeriensis TaxID=256037 RepID=A0A9W6GBN6_9ACTN|nr:carbohydrate ABC transporter permease [Glycomyces algeriensis]MDA1365673.1 carbohydrate ABC transporter permease [Glycomyces algeriensis]MDR7351361.1 putative aldouronate transport system permease protein [Glycomyces algeriensis]GLI44076.1 sugar ABC transporter permease [Glycomyces algeriensis]
MVTENLPRKPDIAHVRKETGVIRESPGYRVFRVANAIVLLLVCAVTLYPFVNLVAKAFSSEGYIAAGEVNLLPRGFNLDTFRVVLGDDLFWTNYANTFLYTVVGTVIAMALTATYAYALSKPHLKGRKFFVGIAVFTMFFGGGLIPNYILIANTLGWRNSMWAVVVPGALSVFNLLVMKAFFENFPAELEEAAAIDGLTTYGVFLRIVLPLSKAVLATMTLFYAVGLWNSWFSAFLYMDDKSLFPVTVYLRNLIAAATGTQEIADAGQAAQVASNIQAVTMLLTVLPIICLYPFIQRYFVSGVMLGSVKG